MPTSPKRKVNIPQNPTTQRIPIVVNRELRGQTVGFKPHMCPLLESDRGQVTAPLWASGSPVCNTVL